MRESTAADVAIVDYGMGNLFSVQRACEVVGLSASITSDPVAVREAPAVILPGVGAMPDAMDRLNESGLSDALRDVAGAGTPVFGVCLGMQLLMEHGSEFVPHRGLGIIPGSVVRFEGSDEDGARLRVPHIGWNAIHPHHGSPSSWYDSPLASVIPGELMYFVHSFYVVPRDDLVVAALAKYGSVAFCAAIQNGNIFACQFHPERSGARGLDVFRAFARQAFGRVSSSSLRG